MDGLPEAALDTLVRLLARVCDDPPDPVFSTPRPSGHGVWDAGDLWSYV